jgi:hypothetical protein
LRARIPANYVRRKEMYKCGACGGSYSHRTLTPHAYICEEEGGGTIVPHSTIKPKIKLKYIMTPYGGTFVRDLEAEMEEEDA